jgi:signal transduction histidine kinase
MLDVQQIAGFKTRTSPGKLVSYGFLVVYQALSLIIFCVVGWANLSSSRLQDLPAAPASFIITGYLLGLVFLISGLWAFLLCRMDPVVWSFTLFSSSAAITLATSYNLTTTQALAPIWVIALGFTAGGLVALGMHFPQRIMSLYRFPWLRWVSFIVGVSIIASGLFRYARFDTPEAGLAFWRPELMSVALLVAGFLVMMAYHWRKALSPIARDQAKIIFLGGIFSTSPLGIGWVVHRLQPTTQLGSFLLIPLALFPLFTTYAILRHRIPQLNQVLSRGLATVLLALIIASAYALMVAGASVIFNQLLSPAHPLITGLVVFILAVIFNPLRSRLQILVEGLLGGSKSASPELLQAFGRQLTRASQLSTVVELVRATVESSVNPGKYHLFLFDATSGHYVATPDQSGERTSDLNFRDTSPLVRLLTGRGCAPVFMRMEDTFPASLMVERTRLALLNAHLFFALPGRERLNGWLALGARLSGEPYTIQELNHLESLVDQSALAVERAQVITDLERRVQEMDVLGRITQGINITLNFDDILELIYTQTNRLIPTRDFAITLTDTQDNTLYHAFFLQDDERLHEMEHRPLPEKRGLEREILQSGRPLVTEHYLKECRSRGILPSVSGIFAWAGVPLNSGAGTIGIFSMGSREPDHVYSSEQVHLLQAIADQAAGAIVKARLLAEAEQRARQLSTLNDVARVLGSTLDIDLLLERILSSAVDILACQAGTLFLVDEESHELIFRVTVGPVAADLVGHRLPQGTGLVGKAVELRAPVVANDVLRNKDWFAQQDQETGFRTESLLISPMIVKDQVIGVIEVINKQNGMPFTEQDQELLAAFASQAAVAYENARLYTLTDMALAGKVEELSVMQRIDRELNASLDIERAMRITLEWALRQSGADAGLVGMLQKDGSIAVMTHQGYPGELEPYLEKYVLDSFPAIQRAIESGQPQATSSSSGKISRSLLQGGHSQIVAPIRRETEVIGLLVLESHTATLGSEAVAAFLARLSDHAAIAISNAQLYNAVQQANQAKSDFVSMVSHELKTPMTSIRGYTDLLAAGAVGTVNEAQSNFLNTIRTNVERMQVLVSDLTDVARIEAGRLRLDYSSEAIAVLIEEVAQSTQAQIAAKNQNLLVELADNLPVVWCDRVRLLQILTNLISNAHKYSPEGASIRLEARRTHNQWDQQGAPEVVHISVQDNGYGINPNDQKKIFQKFFRSEDNEIRNVPGTGLGLNITRHLVEIQGGKIWFESEYRRGTTFHFTIPISEVE